MLHVHFGQADSDEEVDVPIEPNFLVGVFGEPGDYRGYLTPTQPGDYTFHFEGTINGQAIDEEFTSGEETFSVVANPADIQFPVKEPSNAELDAKIEAQHEDIHAELDELGNAGGSDGTAKGLAIGGIVLGLGAGGLALARRRTTI